MVAEHFKGWIAENGIFYSKMIMCPLLYHGYKVTNENINLLIEELQYELCAFPKHADALLDHILNLQSQLKRDR